MTINNSKRGEDQQSLMTHTPALWSYEYEPWMLDNLTIPSISALLIIIPNKSYPKI